MICVAWIEREGVRVVGEHWCRAKYKKTTNYQDSVKIACGNTVTLPAGLSDEEEPDCPECLALEVK